VPRITRNAYRRGRRRRSKEQHDRRAGGRASETQKDSTEA
jgi:hypothetical protein